MSNKNKTISNLIFSIRILLGSTDKDLSNTLLSRVNPLRSIALIIKHNSI